MNIIDELKPVKERIHDIQERYKIVINYRKGLIKSIEANQKRFEKIILEVMEDRRDNENFDVLTKELHELSKELSEQTERHTYCLQVLKDVINNPQHLNVVKNNLQAISPIVRQATGLEHHVLSMEKIFSIIKKYLDELLIPNSKAQEWHIKNFIDHNYSIMDYLEYDIVYNKCHNYYEQLRKEIHPIIRELADVGRIVLTLAKKPLELSDEHKKAYAMIVIMISIIPIIIGLLPELTVVGGILEGIHLIGEHFNDAKEYLEAGTNLLASHT